MAVKTTMAAGPATPVAALNGTVQFWDDQVAAAQQASLDVAKFTTTVGGGTGLGTLDESGGIAAVSASAVSATAGVASALFAGGNFGLGAANAVSGSGRLELTIVNYSSNPVVIYDCNPTKIDIADMPNPLASGGSDTLALSGSNTNSDFAVFFLVGSGQASIPFQIQYTYDSNCGSPGRWTLQAAAGCSSEHTYPTQLQMYGLSFTGNSGYPSFSAYTSVIETTSGVLSVAIYDMASQ